MSELLGRRGRIRVLIVDDISETRATLREHVESDPHLCVCGEAGNGFEAIVKFRLLAPDVVSMNVCMPDMDGITATGCLTELPGGARVVMVTVQSEPDYMRRAACAGAVDYLEKPVARDEYVRSIKAIAEQPPQRRRPG